MLVLSRHRDESIMIGDDVVITIVDIRGDKVRLGNEQGSVVLNVSIFPGVQTNVVGVESVWPNYAFEEGIGINALVSAEPGAPNGGAVFHDTAVWIKPA